MPWGAHSLPNASLSTHLHVAELARNLLWTVMMVKPLAGVAFKSAVLVR